MNRVAILIGVVLSLVALWFVGSVYVVYEHEFKQAYQRVAAHSTEVNISLATKV